MKKTRLENSIMPYFLTNNDWFEIIFEENEGWQYKLKKGAPKEAIESYNDYLDERKAYKEGWDNTIYGVYYEDMPPLKLGKYDFTPKYVSRTWEKTYLLEPINGLYYYVFILTKEYKTPHVGHGGPTISPDDRFPDRKRIRKYTCIEREVLKYIVDHMKIFSERLDMHEDARRKYKFKNKQSIKGGKEK